jgi:membrane-bound metal-dependent hydrolase YbcI (DUF457 family)
MGITLAAAQVMNFAVLSGRYLPSQEIEDVQQHEGSESSKRGLLSRIDIRLLLLGSILPDIIDKPLGYLIFRNTINNGRIYCHTLLFTIILSIAAFYLWKYKHKIWLIPVAFGVFMHLVLDEMWFKPHTLLWPLYGASFQPGDWDFYWGEIVHRFSLNPSIYIPEIIGGLVLILFAIVIIRRKHVCTFIRSGRL